MSKHGKTAGKQPTSAAAVARQANPDLTSRELARQVRELRAKKHMKIISLAPEVL